MPSSLQQDEILKSTSRRGTAPLRIVVNRARRLLAGKRESNTLRIDQNDAQELEAVPRDFASHNHSTYQQDSVVENFVRQSNLYPAEELIFAKYGSAIATAHVLDIGVGGGRTTNYLLSRCRSYRAIDYSPAMINACRRRFPECAPDVFLVGDARDLSAERAEGFDFVLFSFNGLDYVDHEDRLRVLAEIRRVLRPGGLFFFSTHSLFAFPFRDPEIRARNKHVDLGLMRRQGWYYLIDRTTVVVTYYIYPDVQKRQLEIAGFEAIEVLDMGAQVFNFSSPPPDWMVHFLCRRSG
jgi:SAM-dependent methyltransferase